MLSYTSCARSFLGVTSACRSSKFGPTTAGIRRSVLCLVLSPKAFAATLAQPPRQILSRMEKVAIFWDYENCALPTGSQASLAVNRIRQLAHKHGSVTTFKTYMEMPAPTAKSMALRSELVSCGVSLIDCPHDGRKDVADKMIMVDMLAFAIDNPAPATIILVSGDRDFAYAVSVLQMRRYNIILLAPNGANSNLTGQASELFVWPSCVVPRAALTPQSPSVSPGARGRRLSSTLSPVRATGPTIASPLPRVPPVVTDWDSPQPERKPKIEGFSLASWKSRQAQLGFMPAVTPPSSDDEPQSTSESTDSSGETNSLEAAFCMDAAPAPPGDEAQSRATPNVASQSVSDTSTPSRGTPSIISALGPQGLTVTPAAPWVTFDDIPTFAPHTLSESIPAPSWTASNTALATPAPTPPVTWADLATRSTTWASVAMTGVEVWGSPVSTSSKNANTASASSKTGFTTSGASAAKSLPTVGFRLLIKVLRAQLAEGNKTVCFSALGALLLKESPKVYELAGVSGLKEYTTMAAEAGVVKLADPKNVPGGTDGNRYVSLRPAYRK